MLTDRPVAEIDGVEWTRVSRSIDVVERRGFRVEIDIEHDLALFRVGGRVYAVSNVCPHKREPAIHQGYVEHGTVTCPMHDWCFDITSGANTTSGGGLATYRTMEKNGWVWVHLPDQ